MKEFKTKKFWIGVLKYLFKVYAVAMALSLLIFMIQAVFQIGYQNGFNQGKSETEKYYTNLLLSTAEYYNNEIKNNTINNITQTPPQITQEPTKTVFKRDVTWGGPDLWEAVNKKRVEYGVNPLKSKDELCTIASIRLNELLELGKLDGHEGFSTMRERRPDLAYIFDNYGTVAEFLAAGAQSADETVALWLNTLGHKQLLTGGEYVWGCIYAQNSFAVAIAAY